MSQKRCKIGPKLLIMTNRKSHMRFRLVQKSSTLDDHELYVQIFPEFCASWQLGMFGRQQRLNEWRQAFIVSERTVAHWKYFSMMYRLRWYCWAILSVGRFSELRPIYQGCRALPFALAGLSCHSLFSFSLVIFAGLTCCIWIQWKQY